MHIILYIAVGTVYIVGFSFLFLWLNRNTGKPVAGNWLVVAFVAKVIAGFAYGYVYANYFPVSDSWVYFEESLKEYHVLLNSPTDFFSTGLQFNDPANLFSTADNAAWSNAGENILIKLLAIFNLVSGSNYYIDV
ncbi:MAG TPA: hypothetical protein VFV68_12915, partial [Agriterribacter sp.]|nr:hypothetical protein [Agriterribacter sp.]